MQDSLQAGRVLLGMLADFEKGSTPYLPEEVASRLAYAVECFLGNPDIPISKTLFLNLNRFKRSLVHIFQISDRSGTSHLAGMAENWSKDFRRGEGGSAFIHGPIDQRDGIGPLRGFSEAESAVVVSDHARLALRAIRLYGAGGRSAIEDPRGGRLVGWDRPRFLRSMSSWM
jgi:hypothetical protein